MQQGDVVTELNGEKIVDGSALQVAVSEMAPGTKITIGVMRNGKPVSLNLTVGQFHGNSEVAPTIARTGRESARPASLAWRLPT